MDEPPSNLGPGDFSRVTSKLNDYFGDAMFVSAWSQYSRNQNIVPRILVIRRQVDLAKPEGKEDAAASLDVGGIGQRSSARQAGAGRNLTVELAEPLDSSRFGGACQPAAKVNCSILGPVPLGAARIATNRANDSTAPMGGIQSFEIGIEHPRISAPMHESTNSCVSLSVNRAGVSDAPFAKTGSCMADVLPDFALHTGSRSLDQRFRRIQHVVLHFSCKLVDLSGNKLR